MAEAANLYVARPSDLDALRAHWEVARAGVTRFVVLEAPLGGGKRALVSELVRALPGAEDTLVLRPALEDREDGLQTLLRLYAALYGALYGNPVLRGRIELSLNAALPQYEKRTQGWIQAFIEGLKKGVPTEGEQTFQVNLPRDNPLIGIAEIIGAISRKIPTFIDLQNTFNSHSISTFAALEALLDLRADNKLMVVLQTEPVDEVGRAWMPAPWLDLLDRRKDQLQRLTLAPWSADDVAQYVASKGLEAQAPARIAELAGGRIGFVAELVEILQEKELLGTDLADVTLLSLTPIQPDEDELEDAPAEPGEGGRKHAGAADADLVFYLCALLGHVFPSGLVADMGNFDRDSIDDLLDATPALVKETQFSKGLGTWLYQFTRGTWRDAMISSHRDEQHRQIGRNVALFLERYLVPRGYEFVVKTIRLYAENGALQRAAVLKGGALSNDRPETWAMTQDLLTFYKNVAWPDPMRRVVYFNLLERMVQSGDVDQAERLVNEVLGFANERQDRQMEALVLFAGSRLDFRRNDHYRARDRARDALKLFTALDDKGKCAEVQNHLAVVEFSDGNANAALDHVREALTLANTPNVQANAEYIRGLVARRANKLPEAAEHFKKANELAGSIGQGGLALEAGFNYGEALIASRQFTLAADVLARVAQIAQSLQNPTRERAAAALLSRAHGELRNFEAALQTANRTLQLTQELKFEKLLPYDIFNVGYFNLLLGRPSEAASLFQKALDRAPTNEPPFLRDLHFHFGFASLRIGERSKAEASLQTAVKHAGATKDHRKVMEANEALAGLAHERGDKATAARLFQAALDAADEGGLREERKNIRRKLEEL